MTVIDPTLNTPWQRRRDAVRRLAGLLAGEHLSPGDRAALRRLSPGDYNRPVFWRLLLTYVPDEDLRREVDEPRWAMLLQGMAEARLCLYQPDRSPGDALAEAGFSGARVEQLLRARGPQFWPLFRRLCQFLATRPAPLDWVQVGDLIFAESDFAETVRRRLARHYYAAIARSQGSDEPVKE